MLRILSAVVLKRLHDRGDVRGASRPPRSHRRVARSKVPAGPAPCAASAGGFPPCHSSGDTRSMPRYVRSVAETRMESVSSSSCSSSSRRYSSAASARSCANSSVVSSGSPRDGRSPGLRPTHREDESFWAWAIVETLRHTGIRLEELLEITHLALVSYQLARHRRDRPPAANRAF